MSVGSKATKGEKSDDCSLLSLQDAAACLGISVRTLRRYRADGRIKLARIGRRFFCSLDQIQALQSSGGGVRRLSRRVYDPDESRMTVASWVIGWRALLDGVPLENAQRAGLHKALDAIFDSEGNTLLSECSIGSIRRSLRGTKVPEFAALLVFDDGVNVMHAVRRLRAVFAW